MIREFTRFSRKNTSIKSLILIISYFFIHFTSIAQNKNTLNGNIRDERSTSLKGISVLLILKQDSSIIKFTETDIKGNFHLRLFYNVIPFKLFF